jgi:hypothetical protein
MDKASETQMTMLNGYIHVRPVPVEVNVGLIAVSSKPHPDLPVKAVVLHSGMVALPATDSAREGEVVLYLPLAGIPVGDGSFIVPEHAILCVLAEGDKQEVGA